MKNRLEKSGFGVCQYLGHRMGVSSSSVRLYFIYTSFVALGSPIIIYLFTAFWLNVRSYIRRSKLILSE
ncbi:MAG: PspC family transcriptional regulator [Bacteroidota bacterium]